MKRLKILSVILLISTCLLSDNIKVLNIIPNNYGANHYFSLEMYEEFGWEITTTAVTPSVNPCFWGEAITVDILVSDITDITEYDIISISQSRWYNNPATAYSDLVNSPEVMTLLQSASESGLIIAATCAGVRVLAAANILDGVQITGQPYYQSEYDAAGALYVGSQIPPVISGNIVTSMRGQYYMKENPEAIRKALEISILAEGGE